MITSRVDFKKALDSVKRFYNSKSTLPVLSQVYLKWGNGMVCLKATDLEGWAEVEFPADTGEEDVETLVSMSELAAMVGAVGLKSKIEISKEDDPTAPVIFNFDGMEVSLATMPVDGFPFFPFEGEMAFTMPWPELSNAISYTAFATDGVREVLKHARFSLLEGGTLEVTTTDGFRLNHYTTEADFPSAKVMLIRASILDKLAKAVGKYNGTVSLFVSEENQVQFVVGGMMVATYLHTDSKFPEVEYVLGQQINANVFVNFLSNNAVATAELAKKMGWVYVLLGVEGDAVTLTSKNKKATSTFAAKVVGEMEGTTVFDPNYLIQALNVYPKGSLVDMRLIDETSPVFFYMGNLTQVVMPMNIGK